jgi:VCBS repeat-containing protein
MAFGDTIAQTVLGKPTVPEDTDNSPNVIAEGAAVNTSVGITAHSTFAGGSGGLAYSLSADSSAGGFKIDPNTGVVTVADPSKIDFETSPGHVYTITVRATQNSQFSSDQTFTISVNDVAPSTPVDSNAAANTVVEGAANGTAVGITASSTDVNGPGVTWSLTGDTSSGGFTINATTGVITVADGSKIDYESASGHAYTVTATASDGTLTTSHAFTINVSDVGLSTPTDSNAAANSVAEGAANGTTVGLTAFAFDPNGPATTYSLTDTAGGRFAINGTTGVVTVANGALLDYEASTSHSITVQATVGAQITTQAFTIGVTDVNDNAPIFSSGATGGEAENTPTTNVVYTAQASDADGTAANNTITYSLSSGGDNDLFTIDGATGAVRFKPPPGAPPDFEAPADGGGNNVYDITVHAIDNNGVHDVTRNVAITITDVNDNAPVFTSATTATTPENVATSTVVYTAHATDADATAANNTVTYSLGGTDAALFDFDSATGQVKFHTSPNSEAPADNGGNNVYDITVTASDGLAAHDVTQNVAITVTDLNDNTPSFTSPTTASESENSAASNVVYTAVATDADVTSPNNAVSFSLATHVAGADDNDLFSIDNATGEVRFLNSPDFENAADFDHDNSYVLKVTATDGGTPALSATRTVTVTVGDLNDNAPVFDTATTTDSTAENNAGYSFNAHATDQDGTSPNNQIAYSLTGDDAGDFNISSSGVLTFASTPDFEAPTDLNLDNVYKVTVHAIDGNGLGTHDTTRDLTITVTDTADVPPAFTSGTTGGEAEGTATTNVVYTATTVPAAGVTFTLDGSLFDNALFAIDSNDGELRFLASPNYESHPGDYHVVVQANAAGFTPTQDVFISVTDVAPVIAPIDGNAAADTVAEGAAVGVDVGIKVVAADGFGPDAVNFTLSNSAGGRFSIDADGTVRTGTNAALINYETSGALHKYTITVVASTTGGTATTSKSYDISVDDVTPGALTDSDSSTNRIGALAADGTPVGITYFASDPNGGPLVYTLTNDDSGNFDINSATGVVTLKAGHAALGPVGTVHTIAATASDGVFTVGPQTFNVTVANDVPTVDLNDANPANGFNFSTAFTEGSAAVAIAANTTTITDPVATQLVSATITLTNAQAADALTLSAGVLAGTGISQQTVTDASTITIKLTGASSLANYQTAIKGILFDNTSENPNTTARIITVVGNDGSNDSNVAQTTITVGAVNDAPALDLTTTPTTVNYTENATATPLLQNAVLSDADNPLNFSSVDPGNIPAGSFKVEITGSADTFDQIVLLGSAPFSVSGTNLLQGGHVIGTISGLGTTLVEVTELTSFATPAVANQLVHAFGFSNSSDDPSATANRTVTFTFTDGGNTGTPGALSTAVTQLVHVIATNDAPVAFSEVEPNINEDDPAGVVCNAFAVDPDNDTTPFDTLTYSIVTGPAHGTLVLTNFATTGAFVYHPNANFNGTDFLTFKVNDGTVDSNTATITFNVDAVNDTPVLVGGSAILSPTPISYVENASPTALLATDATIVDPDAPGNFAGGGFTVTITDAQAGDEIVVLGSSGFTVSGTSLIQGGHPIGTVNFSLGSAAVTNLTAFATPTVVNQLVGAFGYHSTLDDPTLLSAIRHVDFTFDDGGNSGAPGAPTTSNTLSQTINITAVNDAPVNHVPLAAQVTPTDTDITFSPFSSPDNGIFVSDVDADSATVTLTVTHGTLDLAAGFSGLTFTTGDGTGDVTMTFSGTLSDINNFALDGLVYHPDSGYSGTDTLTIVSNDGGNTGGGALQDTDVVNIAVTAGGTDPTLDLDGDNSAAAGNDFATAFTEGGPAAPIADADTAIVETANPDTLTSATITLVNHQANDVLTVNIAGLPVGITSAYDPATGVLTLTSATTNTAGEYEIALQQVSFNNPGDNPGTADRTVTVSVTDTTGASNTAVTTITIAATNDAPTLDLDLDNNHDLGLTTGFTTSYTENGVAVAVADTDVTIADPDNTTLASATITIFNHTAGDLLSISGVLPDGITASTYDSGTGVLTLTGPASVSAYETALQQVVFSNSSDAPDPTDRDIRITVNDGTIDSNLAHTTVHITPANDAPVVDLLAAAGVQTTGTTATFTETSPIVTPVVIAPNVTLTDDGANLTQVVVTETNFKTGDLLGVSGLATPTGDIGNIHFVIDNATHKVTLTPTGATATVAEFQGGLRLVQFDNGSDNPDATPRTFTIDANDGALTGTATATVDFTATNDAPVLDLNGAGGGGNAGLNYAASYTVSTAAVPVVDSDISITDPDNTNLKSASVVLTKVVGHPGDSLTVAGGLPGGITASSSEDATTITVTLTGVATLADYQAALHQVVFANGSDPSQSNSTRTVDISVVDESNATSNLAQTTISVTHNTAPTAGAENLSATEKGGVNNSTGGSNPAPGNVLANDSDTETPSGLTVISFGDGTTASPGANSGVLGTPFHPTGSFGALTLNADGSYTYALDNSLAAVQALLASPGTPNTLTDNFHYTIQDAGGLTKTADIAITIHGANDLPLAVNDLGTMTEESAPTGFLVKPNDSLDPDTGAANTIAISGTVTVTGTPAGTTFNPGAATAATAGGGADPITVTLTSAFQQLKAGETATVNVPYTITGNAGETSAATLAVTVNGADDLPSAFDDDATITEDATLAQRTISVLANNGHGADILDLDHGALNQIATGAVTVAATGHPELTSGDITLATASGNTQIQVTLGSDFQNLQAGEHADVTIHYTLQGNTGELSGADLHLTVNGVNDAPVVTAGTGGSFTENAVSPSTVVPNLTLSDVDNSTLNKITVTLNNIQTGDVLSVNGSVADGNLASGVHYHFASSSSIEFTTNSGTPSLVDYQNAAHAVQFTNPLDNLSNTARSFTITADDGQALNHTGTANATFTVTAVNDAPVNTIPPGNHYASSNTTTPITGLSVADVDAGTDNVQVTLGLNHGGSITLATGVAGGLTAGQIATNGTSSVVITAPLAAINATFADSNGVIYKSSAAFNGLDPTPANNIETLQVTTNDLGHNPSGALTDQDSLAIGVIPKVWYIDDVAPASPSGPLGSITNPFVGIAAFDAVNDGAPGHPAAGDTVFLYSGSYSTGIILLDNQKLIGQGDGLAVQDPFASAGTNLQLVSAGTRPVITVASGIGIDLASGNNVHGLDVATTASGAIGIDDGAANNSVGSLSISNMQITGTGKAVDIDHGGALSVTLDQLTSTGSSTQGINLGGNVTGNFTVNNNASTIAGASGTDFNISTNGLLNVTYNGGITQASNAALLSVAGGHTGTVTFQNGTLSATNGSGLQFDNADGTYNFNGTTNLSNSVGGVTANAGIDILNGSGGNFTFGSTLDATKFQITNPSGTAFNLNSGNATVNYHGNITANNGRAVAIDTHTGNTITFDTGSISSSGASASGILVQNNTGGTVQFNDATIAIDTHLGGNGGVNLSSNTGATINFTPVSGGNGLDITTAGGTGFSATGTGPAATTGGTINVTGTGNTITSGTGTALNVVNTTIGASGLTFQSIAANGAASGIILNNTGTSGGLTVTGDSGSTVNASGGIITASTGVGISLTSTKGVSLDQMTIQNGGNDGINGSSVTDFTLTNSTVSGNGNAVGENGIEFTNLAGNVLISGTTVHNSFSDGLKIANTSGTINTLNIKNDTFDQSIIPVTPAGGNGVLVDLQGTAVLTDGSISNSTFTNNFSNGILVNTNNTAIIGVNDATSSSTHGFVVSGSTFHNNNISIQFGVFGTSDLTTDIQNNTIVNTTRTATSGPNSTSTAIVVGTSSTAGTGATLNARIEGNTIGSAATAGSGSSTGSGIRAVFQGLADATILINNNTIRQAPDGFGIDMESLGSTSGGPVPTSDVTITNNNVDHVNVPFNPGTSNFPGPAIYVAGDNQGTAGTLRANITGNTVPNVDGTHPATAQFTGKYLEVFEYQGPDGILQLVDNAPASATALAELQSHNTGSIATGGGTIDLIAGPINLPPDLTPLPLYAAAGGIQASSPTLGETHLTQAQLNSVVAAAIAQWAAAGASPAQLAALAAITFTVADLDGKTVSDELGGHIRVDTDAAGHGWFVDSTPNDNSEFTHAANAAGTDLYTDPSNAAAGHLDLLTAVTHEIGHVLGLDDIQSPADDLMYIDLVDGERRIPDAADVAQANHELVQAVEAALPASAQAATGAPLVIGTSGNDSLDAGLGGKILFGGGGADNFVFGPDIRVGSATAPAAQPITHVADYSAAQGDSFDFSALTTAFHASGIADNSLVRAVEDPSGTFATLQLNTTPAVGQGAGAGASAPQPGVPNWVNVAQIDGAHAGDAVNVLVDSHSAVHLAQIHVDLLV